ncbi:hypothetical protein B0T17DRAFT_489948 [Bombardia bombarda]|uniref:F-box domain-containing protein n=1 Tax=Bombardia bombarda TaxID=252184 RepID=A0AA39X9B3_9PEZI|nr:hypothetical protein B0T17DRAFT_489948 [Bombardia bombarda]
MASNCSESTCPITIDALPTELLFQVLGYLETPPPSDDRLHDQPKRDMLDSHPGALKEASLVCKRWRATAMPLLFRHVHWKFSRFDMLLYEQGLNNDPFDIFPLLAFLQNNDLCRYVDSLTITAGNSVGLPTSVGLGEVAERTDASAGHHAPTEGPLQPSNAPSRVDNSNWLWDLVFDIMDPTRVTILATPEMLAVLISCMLFLGDAWGFNPNMLHILSLSREARSMKTKQALASLDITPRADIFRLHCPHELPRAQLPRSRLFTARPWTHLLLNEGSSTRVYQTYEFFLKQPPSVLGALLGCEEAPNDIPLIPPTVKSLSYVAIFPLSSHFNNLVSFLPPIDRLFVQLVPRNDILRDPVEMRHIQLSDLWMERNSCYSLIMRELLADYEGVEEGLDHNAVDDGISPPVETNWRYLREFESGDAADRDAWELAVQFVRMSGTGWYVEREGVFAKGPRRPPSESSDDSAASYADSDNIDDSQTGIQYLWAW